MRAAEQHNTNSLTVSILDNLRKSSLGFNNSISSRTDIGYKSARDMLEHRKSTTVIHELRHQMFVSRTSFSNRPTLYSNRIYEGGQCRSLWYK